MLSTKIRFFQLFLASIILISFVSAEAEQVVDRIRAVVNDEVILESDVKRALAESKEKKNDKATLNNLIDNKLLSQTIKKSDIKVTDDELQDTIVNILRSRRLSFEALKAELQSRGKSYDQYKQEVTDEMKKAKFINQKIAPQVKITERDLRDYYESHTANFKKSYRAHIHRILMPLPDVQSQENLQIAYVEASKVASEARSGVNFETLAKKYSIAGDASNGGDMGNVLINSLTPPLPSVIEALSPGEISQPVLTKDGVAIIKLISYGDLTSDAFDKVRDNIYDELFSSRLHDAVRNYVRNLKRTSYIEVKP